ncbi:MAG: lipopolysaccharide biosynthesis protein [Pirellulales bacterium]|nr:lipopolysaccharide biosynthesis protein [Pirellulales bacterium]
MSLREKAAKGIAWSVVHKWGRAVVSIATFVALSRLLPPEAFGLVALACVFTAFVEVFLDQGLGAAVVQCPDLEAEHLDTAFWISVLTGVVLMLGGMLASGAVAAVFGEPQLSPVLKWLSVSFVFSALSSTQIAILQRDLAFRVLAVRSLVAKTLGGVVGLAMAFAGCGVWSLVGQHLVDGVAGVLVLWTASAWRPGLRVSRTRYRTMVSFGAAVVGNNALNHLLRKSDDFLIGYYLGPAMLGYYAVGYRLLMLLTRSVTGITNSVAFPMFSRIQDDPERMRRAFYRVTQYTSLLAFPVFTAAAVLAPELVPVCFGEQWTPSIPVMQILAFMGILQSVLFFNGTVIRASGKPLWELGIMLLNAVANVLGFLAVVRFGIVAVAVSLVVTSYLLAPVSVLAVRRLIGIRLTDYLKLYAMPTAASLAAAMLVLGLKTVLAGPDLALYFRLPVYFIAGAITYVLVLVIAAPSLSRQVVELARMAPEWRWKQGRRYATDTQTD